MNSVFPQLGVQDDDKSIKVTSAQSFVILFVKAVVISIRHRRERKS